MKISTILSKRLSLRLSETHYAKHQMIKIMFFRKSPNTFRLNIVKHKLIGLRTACSIKMQDQLMDIEEQIFTY